MLLLQLGTLRFSHVLFLWMCTYVCVQLCTYVCEHAFRCSGLYLLIYLLFFLFYFLCLMCPYVTAVIIKTSPICVYYSDAACFIETFKHFENKR